MAPRRVGWRTGSCCTGHRDLPVVWSGLPRAVPLARSVPRGVNDRKLLLTCRLDSIRAPTVWRGSRSTCTFQLRHECTSCMTYFENSVGIEQNDRPRPGVSAIGFSESLHDHGRAVAGAQGRGHRQETIPAPSCQAGRRTLTRPGDLEDSQTTAWSRRRTGRRRRGSDRESHRGSRPSPGVASRPRTGHWPGVTGRARATRPWTRSPPTRSPGWAAPGSPGSAAAGRHARHPW